MKTNFQFKSLKSRLTFWFLILSLLPLIFVIVFSYHQRAGGINKREFGKLTAIRDMKVKLLNDWVDCRIRDIQTIAESPELQTLTFLRGENPLPADADQWLANARELLKRYVRNYREYNEIFIINPRTGKVAVSNLRDLEGEDRSTRNYFRIPLKTQQVFIEDIFYSETRMQPSMIFSIPIHLRTSDPFPTIGILVARVDVRHSIYDLLLGRTGLGETGETMIVNKDLTILNNLKKQKDAPLKLKADTRQAMLASQGKTGIIESVDYSGKKVLAAFSYIPKTKWGLVTKQDLEELYDPNKQMLFDFLLILVILAAAVYFVGVLWSNIIARPILNMAKIARQIQDGDLFTRHKVTRNDELGYLAESFNHMTDAFVSQMSVERGASEIIETMIGSSELKNLRNALLKKIMSVTRSDLGAYHQFNLESNHFEHLFSIGITSDMLKPFSASIYEGEFGKALESRQITLIRNIPADTPFKFKTFAGTLLPREIVIIPIVNDDRVVAMISLAGFNPYTKESLKILNQIWLFMNTAVANLRATEESLKLSDELKQKNQKLLSQSEMLQSQAKELEQQSRYLRRQNIELELQKQQVEEATRLKSQFLSNMSHELRTPLNSIMALSQVLMIQSRVKLSAEECRFLEIIERNGKNLLALINDILDLSKIEAGRIDVNPQPFSLHTTLQTIVESLEPIAEEKGIRIIQQIPDEFRRIDSDEARIYQILQNIIGNAVKFTEKGQVNISVSRENQNILIRVADTGIGIAEKDLPCVFDEFRQVDGSSSRKFEGTGLGLAIARKSTELLGGRITVESTIGKGSTFTVSFPATSPHTVTSSEPGPVRTQTAAGIHPTRKTVLIVDDDPDIAAMITDYLLCEGYNTLTATSGEEALRLAAIHHPFAITLDIFMPDLDGWEVLQQLKKNPDTKHIPVVVITISEDKETGLALGAVGFITKPVDKIRLISEIYKVTHAEPHLVMIVEDNKFERDAIVTMLEEEGLSFITAENGRQCLDILNRQIPDVLVLDLMIPEINGFKVLDHIRQTTETRNLPVIISTAKDLSETDRKKLSGRVSTILSKSAASSPRLLAEIKRQLAEIDKQPPPQSGIKQPEVSEQTPTILVVEDNPDNMITITAALKAQYTILKAVDGEEGLQKALTGKPDLILLDMALPKIDGYTVVKKLKENTKTHSIPIIALTAHAMKGDREKIINAGCNDYVSKPFDFNKLLHTIQDWLDQPQ